eukprot:CAMPEP_0117038236 /NCGR_PEP_ID=MMETSP0472-20121206/26922_1 /TAXON_ID=693140 ORGANISM="Tiarina fusus, Strain LIS" /NCGR_SAMPLE_ID=MMETSP0472 /ASSEMBLY_ACC=CAM_ASM_000603 /LENGTH=156 /DNA_ID=CAMNT_0004748415 /DNA_START=34 /DNA_END=501 /DNA_ORIENTATION=-
MKVLQLLMVMIVLVAACFATRAVRTCNGSASASSGMKIFMADCPAYDDEDVSLYDCGEANTGGTWMSCEKIEQDAIGTVPGAANAQSIISSNCDDDDYSNGVFSLVTSGGTHTDKLCITAIKHDHTTSLINFCNNLPSSLYNAIYNPKGMCENSVW